MSGRPPGIPNERLNDVGRMLAKTRYRCTILSANFGGYDSEHSWPTQEPFATVRAEKTFGRWAGHPGSLAVVEFVVERFNDTNFPGRELALTSRLKPALVKMFGWELSPGAEYYVWVDASKTVVSSRFGIRMLEELGDSAEFAVFRHPERQTVQEEYEFVKRKLAEGNEYLLSRYAGEFLEEQWLAIYRDRRFVDDRLYASTGFAYRPSPRVKRALREWWFHKTRYLLHDQLALPYVLWRHGVRVRAIEENIYKFPLWEHSRPRAAKRSRNGGKGRDSK